jgi:L-malate glycosyltransferase
MSHKKLLVISHSSVNTLNQLIFSSLLEQFSHALDVTLVVPSNWRNEYTGKLWDATPHPTFKGRFVTLPVAFSGHITLHFYRHGVIPLLREERPDWVYIEEEPWALSTQQFGRLINSLLKVPFLFHYNQNILKRYPPPFAYMEQWVFKHAAHGLPVGESSAKVLRDKGYQNPMTIFPYFIDDSLYYPREEEAASFRLEHGVTRDNFIFGYLGRFVEEKGLISLVQAFHQVISRHPEAVLWLIGSGPDEQKLSQLAFDLGLKDTNFKIIPSIPHAKAPVALSAMDTLVLPSLTRRFWREQFGRVIIEALACGTPVIGSDSGEIPFLIRKLDGGIVFPEGNVNALAEAMSEIMEHSRQTASFVEYGRKKVLEEYTHSHLARGFYQILQTLG